MRPSLPTDAWGPKRAFGVCPSIHSTAVGYCADLHPTPTKKLSQWSTGHTEGVMSGSSDPTEVKWWIFSVGSEAHDPCSGMGQGNDQTQ
jgi:peptide methionine sulfoxide reductase MsrA